MYHINYTLNYYVYINDVSIITRRSLTLIRSLTGILEFYVHGG